MKERILQVIKQTVVDNMWEDCNLLVRDMFTTIIYVDDMCIVDTESMLKEVYEVGDIVDAEVSYKEFKYFILQDIMKQF